MKSSILWGLLIGALSLFALAALAGCVSTEDYNMTPAEAYSCAAKTMGVDAPGPVPTVVYRYGFWEVYLRGGLTLVQGTYSRRSRVVTVTISRKTNKILVHEMVHAIRHQLGRPISEVEAYESEALIPYLC